MSKKAISLISSGIDSPVATYMMIKQGLDIIAIHFNSVPFSDGKSIDIVKQLLRQISKVTGKKVKLYIIAHGPNFSAIKENCYDRFTCILCKRMMMRIANAVADKEGAEYILSGENLGQVASQTLENMKVIDECSEKIILRPLLCNDKTETMKLAKEIGTYEISIQKCACCLALPPNPATRSTIEKIMNEEKRIDIKKLVEDAINSAEIEII